MTKITNMIYTSNFSKYCIHPNAVSIARGTPSWFKGLIIEELQPDWKIVLDHKNKLITDKEYVIQYIEQLKSLDIKYLNTILEDKILLCWCKSAAFCHRHVIRRFLQHHGIESKEL